MITKAARRYASALLQIGEERQEVESILRDIEFIKNTLDDSRDLQVFLQSPVIKFDDKTEALEKIFGDEVGEVLSRFITLLGRKNRLQLFPQIVDAFMVEYNIYAGIINVEVSSASELNEEQLNRLREALESKTGKKVKLVLKQDESLRGGIAVRIEDTVIDGTIKHKLEQLSESLMSTETAELN